MGLMTSATRALVVEDEPDLAALVGSYLERAGMSVTLCHAPSHSMPDGSSMSGMVH